MILTSLNIQSPAPEGWPYFLPPIQQITRQGLDFKKPITFLVGENGSGKSTLIEAIASKYGLDVRGGHGGRKYSIARPQENQLAESLILELTSTGMHAKVKRSQGFFLRSETALGVFEFMSDWGVPGYGARHLSRISHGEGYIQVLLGRFKGIGLYLLDEPEAALSFTSCLTLMKQLREVIKNGSQVICATHSPIITALPEADILELSENGVERKEWAELQLTQYWQRFMDSPEKYLADLG